MDLKSRLAAFEEENQHLQQVVEKVKTMLDNNQRISHIGSWEWNIQSGEVTWTNELYRILGFKPGEIKPDYDTAISFIHPDDKQFAETLIQKAIDEGKIYQVENRLIRKDGSIGYVISKGTVIIDKNKNAVSMAGTIQDVTDRKMLEARIQNAQKLESLGVIAGGIAHDFNNLLAIVIGNAELAQMHQPAESKAQHFINTIIASAHRGADLCDQMFAYAGKQTVGKVPTDLNKIITEMVHLLDVSILKTEIIYELEPKLPSIEANMAQIRQVIMNLITNASESFGDRKGKIRIKTGLRWFNDDYFVNTFIDNKLTAGEYVFLEVIDTGSGIS
ncbi:MAG: nitrogen regulation protein NR(II), partial [Calditrichaceae bacterium]